MIDEATVGKILEAAQIEEVVSDFMTLKKRGANYIGCCPFHSEKTPSFSVSPAKNIYKCFGCGAAGSPVSFVMKHENMTYPEALKYLADKYHIPVKETIQSEQDIVLHEDRESMNVVNEFAAKHFIHNLLHTDQGMAVGLTYFQHRGFRPETIKKFALGYSLENRTEFTQTATEAGYNIKYLEKTGLTIVKEDGYKFDRFAGRVMFPIHSIAGKIVAFGGRMMVNDKKIAKYVNSPESEIYHKSNVLYGIYQAKNAIVKKDKCYLVEGYCDVISMYQSGIENTVASSGTSLTQGQIGVIKRFTNNLTVIYDGDSAGIKASLRGIDLILEQDINVKVVLLPKDEDPDSFAQNHTTQELEMYIDEHEEDFIKFKTRILLDETKNDPIARTNVISSILGSISKISNAVTRSVYIKECSRLLDVKEDALYAETGRLLKKQHEDFLKDRFRKSLNNSGENSDKENQNIDNFSADIDNQLDLNIHQQNQLPAFVENVFAEKEEKEIVEYLINYGNLEYESFLDENGNQSSVSVATYIIGELLNEDLKLENLIYNEVFTEYKNSLLENKEITAEYFLNNPDEKIRNFACDITISKNTLSNIWAKRGSRCQTPDDTYKDDIPKTILCYKMKILEQAVKKELEKLKNKDILPDDLKTVMDNIKNIYRIRNEIAQNLDRIIVV